MRKILAVVIAVMLSVIMLCGCVSGDMTAPQEGTEYQIWLNSGSCFVYSFKDETTGVWYIVGREGITPRLNADGTLYVTE